MSDRLFASCCLGSPTAHALWEPCPFEAATAAFNRMLDTAHTWNGEYELARDEYRAALAKIGEGV